MDEASAALKAMRPCLTTGSVGSSSVIVAATRGASSKLKSTTETEFSTAFSTHACRGAPLGAETKAIPRGAAPTATRPSTVPSLASTVNSLFEPAAVATKVASSSLTWMPNGVARAMPSAGCSGGNGSRSKRDWRAQLEAMHWARLI